MLAEEASSNIPEKLLLLIPKISM